MKKYKFKGKEMLEDITHTAVEGVCAAACLGGFVGLEYINQKFLDGAMPNQLPGDTLLLSKEAAFWGAQYFCAFGTLIGGISTAYNSAAIPLKLASGKYFSGQVGSK